MRLLANFDTTKTLPPSQRLKNGKNVGICKNVSIKEIGGFSFQSYIKKCNLRLRMMQDKFEPLDTLSQGLKICLKIKQNT